MLIMTMFSFRLCRNALDSSEARLKWLSLSPAEPKPGLFELSRALQITTVGEMRNKMALYGKIQKSKVHHCLICRYSSCSEFQPPSLNLPGPSLRLSLGRLSATVVRV